MMRCPAGPWRAATLGGDRSIPLRSTLATALPIGVADALLVFEKSAESLRKRICALSVQVSRRRETAITIGAPTELTIRSHSLYSRGHAHHAHVLGRTSMSHN